MGNGGKEQKEGKHVIIAFSSQRSGEEKEPEMGRGDSAIIIALIDDYPVEAGV